MYKKRADLIEGGGLNLKRKVTKRKHTGYSTYNLNITAVGAWAATKCLLYLWSWGSRTPGVLLAAVTALCPVPAQTNCQVACNVAARSRILCATIKLVDNT
jgi:hypothetical protein